MDEIEVSTEPDKKDDTPVSFIEQENETHVTVGEPKDKSESGRVDDDRWRRAEENQNRLSQDLAEVRSRLAGGSGPVSYASPSAAPDRWKSQEDAISDQERALGIQWEALRRANQLDSNKLTEFDQKARELNQRRTDIAAQRAIEGALPSLLQASQQQQFRAEYGDVQSNQNANRWARGYFDQLVAQGAPDNPDTVRQAMNAARVHFRIGNYAQNPTDRDRQQLQGFSGATGRRNVGAKDNVVKMGKPEKIMAMAMYGEAFKGDEKKAYAQWAKGPGIKAQKAMQKGRRAAG